MYHSSTSIRRPNKDGLPVRTAMGNRNIEREYRVSLGQKQNEYGLSVMVRGDKWAKWDQEAVFVSHPKDQ